MKERGAVALETLLVIGIWFLIIFFFLNILFVLASASLAQSGVNRFALEVGALGCMPPAAEQIVQERVPTFASDIEGVEAKTWPSDDLFLEEADGEELASCLGDEGATADLGAPIRVAVRYRQNVILPDRFLGIGDQYLDVRRSATVTSSRIESGSLEEVP